MPNAWVMLALLKMEHRRVNRRIEDAPRAVREVFQRDNGMLGKLGAQRGAVQGAKEFCRHQPAKATARAKQLQRALQKERGEVHLGAKGRPNTRLSGARPELATLADRKSVA